MLCWPQIGPIKFPRRRFGNCLLFGRVIKAFSSVNLISPGFASPSPRRGFNCSVVVAGPGRNSIRATGASILCGLVRVSSQFSPYIHLGGEKRPTEPVVLGGELNGLPLQPG
jgi:hypothetical protein